jgi:hypothetical protein
VWSAIDAEVRRPGRRRRQRYDFLVESAFEILRDEHQSQVFASGRSIFWRHEQAALPPRDEATSSGSQPNSSMRWIRVGSARLPRTS